MVANSLPLTLSWNGHVYLAELELHKGTACLLRKYKNTAFAIQYIIKHIKTKQSTVFSTALEKQVKQYPIKSSQFYLYSPKS